MISAFRPKCRFCPKSAVYDFGIEFSVGLMPICAHCVTAMLKRIKIPDPSFAAATPGGNATTDAGFAPAVSVVATNSREPVADVGNTKQMVGPPDTRSAHHVSASGPRDSIPADPGPCGFGPLQFCCPICARIDCNWTHGPHPDFGVKYAAASASRAASDSASNDISKSVAASK
jgi:hypothetical protein